MNDKKCTRCKNPGCGCGDFWICHCDNPPVEDKKEPQNQDWVKEKLKEFDRLFLAKEDGNRVIKTGLSSSWGNEIKFFISSLLLEIEQRVREEAFWEGSEYQKLHDPRTIERIREEVKRELAEEIFKMRIEHEKGHHSYAGTDTWIDGRDEAIDEVLSLLARKS